MILRTQRSRAVFVVAFVSAIASIAYTARYEWPSDDPIFVYVPNAINADDARSPALQLDFVDVSSALSDPGTFCSSRLLDWPNRQSDQSLSSGYRGYEYCARADTDWEHFVAKFEVFERFVEEEKFRLQERRAQVAFGAFLRWIGVLILLIGALSILAWVQAGRKKI